MRLSTLLLTSLTGLAKANFDLYLGHQVFGVDGGAHLFHGWYIFDNDPSINDVFAYGPYLSQDDVSGSTTGVRCAGSGCYGGAATDINVLEMHFSNNPLYHWSKSPFPSSFSPFTSSRKPWLTISPPPPPPQNAIYKDRGHPYKMYGLDGRIYGECILFPGVNFHHLRFVETRSGVRKFRCLTQFTAAQIRDGR
ncbi:Putative protein of unknown function [Podospora comata]|uniref:Uncharacterized protein n=1 Tax=Podospora comata TaxID=48703 RepID=A0ABY6S0F9_PODCO|nr:Putative protein of unknown function [Podospora comata]